MSGYSIEASIVYSEPPRLGQFEDSVTPTPATSCSFRSAVCCFVRASQKGCVWMAFASVKGGLNQPGVSAVLVLCHRKFKGHVMKELELLALTGSYAVKAAWQPVQFLQKSQEGVTLPPRYSLQSLLAWCLAGIELKSTVCVLVTSPYHPCTLWRPHWRSTVEIHHWYPPARPTSTFTLAHAPVTVLICTVVAVQSGWW